jgi:hypothetical protein
MEKRELDGLTETPSLDNVEIVAAEDRTSTSSWFGSSTYVVCKPHPLSAAHSKMARKTAVASSATRVATVYIKHSMHESERDMCCFSMTQWI